MVLLPDKQNCGLRMRRECRGECFPRHWLQRNPLLSDPGMHYGTCVTVHVGIANPWCRGKRSRYSRRTHNPQFYISGKRPMYQFVIYNSDAWENDQYLAGDTFKRIISEERFWIRISLKLACLVPFKKSHVYVCRALNNFFLHFLTANKEMNMVFEAGSSIAKRYDMVSKGLSKPRTRAFGY